MVAVRSALARGWTSRFATRGLVQHVGGRIRLVQPAGLKGNGDRVDRAYRVDRDYRDFCPLPEAVTSGLDYVRALATLENGESAEDLLFLGADAPEQVDVRLVELYVSVLDSQGRPVTGLDAPYFRVLEEGEAQSIERLEQLEDLSLNVAILMDISSSMGRRVRVAAESAQRFFDNILTEDDTASLLAFNHDLHLIEPFTADARRLRHGASGLRAWGSTRLYDGIVYALFQYGGLENRRALVVLSDGADTDSNFPFEQVMGAAVRSGVAVYPISLGSRALDAAGAGETNRQLSRLAAATGGSFFKVATVTELDSVYRRIEEELRSQYLLVYRPSARSESLDFRPVEVEVLRPGLRTRNVHGYYP